MTMKLIFVLVVLFVAVYGREGFGPGEQNWGYVQVRQDAHIFYWLYHTTALVKNATEKPLVIWLQGGPGSSSTGYGNFAELGPLDVNLKPRNTSWTSRYNVLFVDNPVGSGFSYVENNAYAMNNTQIAKDFLVFLKGFYQQNPEFQASTLHIFSESYGGKMTAEIALLLDKAIKAGDFDIKFKGIGLGDSWISPIDSVLTWPPYLLNLGIIDQNGYNEIQNVANDCKEALNKNSFLNATKLWSKVEYIVDMVTSGVDFYNVLRKTKKMPELSSKRALIKDAEDEIIDSIMNTKVKNALNISRSWGSQSNKVFEYLAEDFMKPVTNIVEELLNSTDILIAVYNGQLDLIVDTPGTVKWLDNLNWDGAPIWKVVERLPLVVDDNIEGYIKAANNLWFFWVNRAGHMVPADNPAAMFYILKHITERRC
ncbi:unnamed protein product [Brassicogethes aeneus]|uniref:Carboxypeptidase n=1 Tax=Brassicogethes aeneus TaxID=1431903 RepID=A0A9P0FKH7_BRAAE|nr:unnamed protein product [Brassicogethes aeneus]